MKWRLTSTFEKLTPMYTC